MFHQMSYTFVFGVADPPGGCHRISIARQILYKFGSGYPPLGCHRISIARQILYNFGSSAPPP